MCVILLAQQHCVLEMETSGTLEKHLSICCPVLEETGSMHLEAEGMLTYLDIDSTVVVLFVNGLCILEGP